MSILKVYGGKTLSVGERQKVLEGVGSGSIPVNTVMKKLFSFDELMQPLVPVPLKVVSTTLPIEKKILLGGEAGLPVRIAQCCLPEEGQRIVGYVTREHASIHRIECNHLQSSNPARILEARWVTGQRGVQKYSVRVMIEGVNRIGLIRDITSIIADMNINILDFSLRHQDERFVTRSLLLEIDGYEQLDDILRRLEGISGVVNVMREESREHRWISAPKRSVRSKASKESD
jgi:guanosine-3',5'-bis(diphosphate) 3'-pyrophosphohydrolase